MAKKKLGEISAYSISAFAVTIGRMFCGEMGKDPWPWRRARLAVTQEEYDRIKEKVLKVDGEWHGRYRGIPLIIVESLDDDFVPPEMIIRGYPRTHIDHRYDNI